MIERLFILIEAGNDETHLLRMTPMLNGEPMVEQLSFWKDEKAIAQALRNMADRIEQGVSFMSFDIGLQGR